MSDGYIGSFVTLWFSCVAFGAMILLPSVIDRSSGTCQPPTATPLSKLFFSWSASLALSATLMLLTLVTSDYTATSILIAINGVSWAITNWLPFALIGRLTAHGGPHCSDDPENQSSYNRRSSNGAISGLHNVAISAPQVLAAGICSMVFWATRAAGSPDGSGWVLRTGGLAYLAAGCVAFRTARSIPAL